MEVEKINHVIIEHTPAGKYFAVLNVDFEPEPRLNAGRIPVTSDLLFPISLFCLQSECNIFVR